MAQQQQQGNQPLPSKEANLLRQVVKFYESKQYKKGVKAADQILKKFPEHGETLAMRGLTLSCLERKEEAYDYVRRGLQFDLKSHVCWHVYGLLYRSDRLYKKAITCYMNALKHDKDNIQILRDLALLQIQMRDLNGFLDNRHRLLQLRPNNRNNWIAFAVGHYLNKNYDVAVQVLTAYESTLDEVSKEDAYEHSEMLLFKSTILEEASKFQDALDHHEKSQSMIKDKIGYMEMKGRLLTKLGQNDKSEGIYRQLLRILPDNYEYHTGLMKALSIEEVSPGKWSAADQEKLEQVYNELIEENPASMACSRIPLDFKEGDAFVNAVAKYVVKFINRGIPSLFSDLKPLYRCPEKAAALGKHFEGLRKEVQEDRDVASSTSDEHPQATVWVLYYLALHYDLMGKYELGLQRISEAMDHTPTVPELLVAQSKILKHVGDLPGSAMAADHGRLMDLADRYLNCVAVKAAFRCGKIEEAERMAALFTKDENQISNLVEMQCMWYEIACGKAHLKNKEYGKALKKFLGVSKHFEDFVEDQFDFHGYCVRKMTLRSYIDLLKIEDDIYGEIAFSKAAWGAIQCYLDLYDNPSLRKLKNAPETTMSPAESAAAKKKEAIKKQEEEKAILREKSKGKKANPSIIKADPDPDGDGLAAVDDLLGEATKLVTILREHAGKRIQTHKYAFEVYMRKQRMLLALSAVNRALELEGIDSPVVHCMIIRFCKIVSELPVEAVSNATSSTSETETPAEDVVHESVQDFMKGSSLLDYNKKYLDTCGQKSLMARAAAAEMLALLDPADKASCVELIMANESDYREEVLKEEDCQHVHELLEHVLEDSDAALEWKKRCSTIFEWSAYFEGQKQMPLTNGITRKFEGVSLGPEA